MVTFKYTSPLRCWWDMKQENIYSLQYLNCIFCLSSLFEWWVSNSGCMHSHTRSYNTKWTQKMVWTTQNDAPLPRSTRELSESYLTAQISATVLSSNMKYGPAMPSLITSHNDIHVTVTSNRWCTRTVTLMPIKWPTAEEHCSILSIHKYRNLAYFQLGTQ